MQPTTKRNQVSRRPENETSTDIGTAVTQTLEAWFTLDDENKKSPIFVQVWVAGLSVRTLSYISKRTDKMSTQLL